MKKSKKVLSALLALTLVFSSFPSVFAASESGKRVLDLVDSNASDKTKSLFAYLQDIGGEQVLFGHQHATDEGLTITGSGTRAGSTQSEVKNSVGDYPAIFGWDTLSLDGDEKPGSTENTDEQNRQNLIASMKVAHDLGGIVALSMHPPNFATGGRYNDTSSKDAVADILPGGPANATFNAWLDNLALFAQGLKDDKGELIPVIFRPFHEQNGGWFWWGAQTTTTSQYKELYRYTVEYLRDKKNVSNFLYAFSPNGPFDGNPDDYLTTYPGDQYVDIIGLDQYDNQSNPGSESFISKLVNDLAMVSQLAEEKNKISAFTEYGYSPQGMKTTGNGDLEWFTKILNAIKSDPDAKKVSYMQTWANFALGGNLFVPYKGYKNAPEGGEDHELLPDFTEFYKDPYSGFLNEVGDAYGIKDLTTTEEKPFMHIVTPTLNSEVKASPAQIRVKVINDTPEQVIYTVEGSDNEVLMTLDEEGMYYTADWLPPASLNGGTANITVKALLSDRCTILEETSTVIVKVSEIDIKTYTFDDDTEGVKSNGAYPETINSSFEHEKLAGDGKLKIQADGLEQSQSWQELKLELTDLDDVNLSSVKRVKFDALVPASAGTTNASLLSVAMLPPDWDTKYGESTTTKQFSDLERVTIDGVEYVKFSASIDLNNPAISEEATGLALSLISKELNLDGNIYVDNIQLLSVFAEAPNDPSLVDDFESYLGSDAALATDFVAANGNVSISLDGVNKNDGTYGLKYDYTLTPGGYTGITKTLNNLDWSDSNHLQFWLKPDGKAQKLVIQIQIDGISFEAYPSLESTEAGVVKVPFSEFTPAPWDTANAGKVITKEYLKDVSKFSIYINAQDDIASELNGLLYFDDIRVGNDGTGGVPNGGSGPGSMPEQPGTLYDFEDDKQGWVIEQNNANATNAEVTEEAAEKGVKSLSSEFDLEGTLGFEFSKVQTIDLSAVDALTAKVKLSEGTANARLYIKTGADWAWIDSGVVEVDNTEFKTLTIDLASVENRNSVNAIGIKIEPTSGSGKARAFVDNIELIGDVEPDPETNPTLYHFEDGVQGWKFGYNENLTPPPVVEITDVEAAEGMKSLTTTVNLTGGKLGLRDEVTRDLTGEEYLSVNVKLSSGTADAKLFVQPSWGWADSGVVSIDSNGFTTIILPLADIENLHDVKAIGVEIIPTSGEGNASVYIDNVSLTNGAVETADAFLITNSGVTVAATEVLTLSEVVVVNSEIDQSCGNPGPVDPQNPEGEKPGTQDPDTGNPEQEPNNPDPVSDPNEPKPIVPVSKDSTVEKSENKLPETATNQFNWLLLGIFAIAGGYSVILINRRRNKVS
ncbi:mannan endo-1,4-beta-mannosidase [Metabacillus crassostreae]|uniref:glycosyl hydrolase n=1 Tax=Metabacillus crassostreae TaxID=929098 RepID=UPI00195E5FE6|nr:glycosyl hydrolase [Metabacillus crassostreae]MBM7603982.1 mannan endo-1,4-beta-mannosidase [Metabacillus crassostreae]